MRKDNIFRSEEAQAVARTTKELNDLNSTIAALTKIINNTTEAAEKQRLQNMEAHAQNRKKSVETNQTIAVTKFNTKYNTSYNSNEITSNRERLKEQKKATERINRASNALIKASTMLIDAATTMGRIAYDFEYENVSARADLLLNDIEAMAQKALLSANLEAKTYTSAITSTLSNLTNGINEGAYTAANNLVDIGAQKQLMDLEMERIDLETKNTKELRTEQKNANISNLFAQQQQAEADLLGEGLKTAGDFIKDNGETISDTVDSIAKGLEGLDTPLIGDALAAIGGVGSAAGKQIKGAMNTIGNVLNLGGNILQAGAGYITSSIQSENALHVLQYENQKKITEAVLNANQEVKKVWINSGQEVSKAYLQFAQQIENSLLKSEAAANDMGVSMGLYGKQLDEYKRTMFETQIVISKWGKTLEDMNQLQNTYQDATGRNISFSSQDFDTSFALDILSGQNGLSAQLNSSMDIFNHSVSDSNEMFYEMYKNVSKIGLSGRKYLKDLTKNLKLAEKFQFKGGVKGLMNMAKWAQNVRFNMDSLDSVVENFREGGLEGAITKAASMQVLGGNFAKYADPLAMIYESYANPEALVKRQNKMLAGMGHFNSETGEADFNTNELMLMEQFAKLSGQSFQDLLNQRRQAIKGNKVEGSLNKNVNWTTDEKSLITNRAKLENGKWVITMNNGKSKDISTLSREDLDHLMPQDNEEKLVSYVADIRSMMMQLTGAKQYASSRTENATYDTWYNEEQKRIANVTSDFNTNFHKYIKNVSDAMKFATNAQKTMLDMVAQGHETIDKASEQILKEGINIASTLATVNDLLNNSLGEINRRQDEWKPQPGEIAYDNPHATNRRLPHDMRLQTSFSDKWGDVEGIGDKIKDLGKGIFEKAKSKIKDLLPIGDGIAFGDGKPMTVAANSIKTINDGIAETHPNDNAIFAKTGGPFDTLFNGIFGRIDEIYNGLRDSVMPIEPIGKSQFVSSDIMDYTTKQLISASELARKQSEISIKPVEVKLSGSIRLEANGQSVDIMDIVSKNPMLIRQLSQMISDEVGKSINGGRSISQYDYLRN